MGDEGDPVSEVFQTGLMENLDRFSYTLSVDPDEPYAGADPGFPVGGGANSPGGAPTYDFAKFCEKLHEIEKILGRGGGAPATPP